MGLNSLFGVKFPFFGLKPMFGLKPKLGLNPPVGIDGPDRVKPPGGINGPDRVKLPGFGVKPLVYVQFPVEVNYSIFFSLCLLCRLFSLVL